jgi:hypothetical protein
MSTSNRISAVITPEQLAASNDAITAFKNNLSNILILNLTAEERRTMLKMGDKTLAFVKKALEYAAQNPGLVPSFMDLPEAKKDYDLAAALYGIFQQLNTLTTAVEDTGMVAGSEAYEAALVFYHSVKGASRSNVPGSQAIYDDLSQRFPGQRKAKTVPPQL